ncbi:hypothetical protein Tco_0083957 [Tanacetum coccineum]
MSNTNTNLQTQTSSVLQNDTVSSCSISNIQEKTQLSRSRCMHSLKEIKSLFKFLSETLQDYGTMPIFKRTFSQDLDLLEQHLTKDILSRTDCTTTLTNLRTKFENAFNSEFEEQWKRFVTLVKQSQELKTVSYHKLYDIMKQHQNEVNEIRAERLARTANLLALVAQQQPVYHPQTHPTHYTHNSSTKSQQVATRNKGKAIVNSFTLTYDQEPTMVTEDDKMTNDKEIDKLMALFSLSFKKIYKPTNNNLITSSNTSRENQDNTLRINRGTGYDNQRVVNVAGARENITPYLVMSDSEESGITYTAVSSPYEDLSDIEAAFQAPPSPDYVPGPEEPEQAPPSPDYVPGPELADDEIRPEEDDDEDPEEDPIDYSADGGDDGDDEMDIEEDEDADMDIDEEDEDDEMEDEEAEEEHSAPAYPVVVALHPKKTRATVPSAEETEPFETDESAATPPPHPAYRMTARISIPEPLPVPAWSDSEVARLLAISSPPASPLSPCYTPSPIRSLGYRAATIRMRAEAAATSDSPPLPPPFILSPTRPDAPPPLPTSVPTSFPPLSLPTDSHREGRPEVNLPPRMGLGLALGPGYVGYGITDSWDEIVETLQGAPVSTDTELGAHMREFESLVRRDTDEIYTRLDDEQGQRQLLAGRVNMLFRDRRTHAHTRQLMETEAGMSREAWRRAMDSSDLAHGGVISLRTTVYAQMEEITELQSADRRRQRAMSELLETDRRRREEMRELRAADRTRQQQIVQTLTAVMTLQGRILYLSGTAVTRGGQCTDELPEEAVAVL